MNSSQNESINQLEIEFVEERINELADLVLIEISCWSRFFSSNEFEEEEKQTTHRIKRNVNE